MTIQKRIAGVDAAGQPLDQWSTHAETWAGITDRRGREYYVGAGGAGQVDQATVNENTTVIRLRYREDLVPEMRLIEQCHARREFEIVSVRYLNAPRPEMLLECEERRVEVPA